MAELSKPNVYETDENLGAESDRLRSFDMPTQMSVQLLGEIDPGQVLLDIGAGENPGLRNYADSKGIRYLPLDYRFEPLAEHVSEGAPAVQADAKKLPVREASIDVAHARFVLAHFSPEDRSSIVGGALITLADGGKAVFIDYDWTKMDGSEAMQALRDFTLENIKGFDAGYGAHSQQEIRNMLDPDKHTISEKRISSPTLHEYGPVVAVREVTLHSLRSQGANETLVDAANTIFDAIGEESQLDNPPGFIMPDVVAVTVS